MEDLCRLLSLSGTPAEVLPQLEALCAKIGAPDAVIDLTAAIFALDGTKAASVLRLDFSAVGDGRYYNDLVFRGFVKGLPERVLAGGQYDRLLERMGRESRGVGFAVYLDQIALLDRDDELDADVLLLYDEKTSPDVVRAEAARLREDGNSVLTLPSRPKNGRYGKVVTLTGGERSE